ncbi:MAG: hypothetical protein CW338_06880, partial [Clostridiales bacterium]|nr:hypothetical protein [Clostridiales bacterium]
MKKRVIAVTAALIMILSVLPVWESALAASCPPHKWGDWQIDTPATCTEKGRKYRVCTRCTTGFEWKDIPALGHDWKLSQTVREATCIQTGSIREKCTRCGKTRKVDTGYGDHKWGGWYEKSPGLKERDCQLCGKQEFSYSPVLEISFTEVSAPEKGFYTEGETVHYSVSVYNRGAGDATECEIILDENSSSIGTMGYHVTKTLELTYEITAEDVEAGSVSKQVTLKCREKKPVQSGTVTVKTGKEDAGPVHSAVIEVASAPAEVSAEAGT